MDIAFAKNILKAFDGDTFRNFFTYLVSKGNPGLTNNTSNNLMIKQSYMGFDNFYVFDFFPYAIFYNLKEVPIVNDNVIRQLKDIQNNISNGNLLGNIYIVNNLHGFIEEDYRKYAFSKNIEDILYSIFQEERVYGLGNIDSMLINEPADVIEAIDTFVSKTNGLSITISKDGFSVYEKINQKYIDSGISRGDNFLLSSVVKIISKRRIIQEFENVLNSGKEKYIQDFIVAHYREVFGYHYDRLIPELWLRFPELDINNSNRRLDIFLRNSHTDDWEIYEIKRDMKITTTYRNLPTFTSSIYKSLEQLRNYQSILLQDSVKRKIKNVLGIDYFIPEMNLVTGYRPENIQLNSWRTLISKNSKDVKIITFDSLLKEMNTRVDNLDNILKSQNYY